jgi:hypothetical protein
MHQMLANAQLQVENQAFKHFPKSQNLPFDVYIVRFRTKNL